MTTLDRFDEKLHALRLWFDGSRPPAYGLAHGFATTNPMSESDVLWVEEEAGVSLPPEYRGFLLRLGDGTVGPGGFRRVREGLTPASGRPFPLAAPLLGRCSSDFQNLSADVGPGKYKRLLAEWESVPKDDGILSLCDYGCGIDGRLILNGPFRGRVWVLSGDAAYYGPFGGAEALHDESCAGAWEQTNRPRDYSFFEWYESWLDGQLKTAGLADD